MATPSKKELTQEIATIERDVTRFAFGGVLENLDDTLKTRGGGKGLKIYDDLERDCHAYAVLQKRKLAIIARPWEVLPASDSALDQRAADLVRSQLTAMSFDKVCTALLDATLKGFAVGEVMWTVQGAELVATEMRARDQRRFVFNEQSELRMLTRQSTMLGEAVPERKFIVHQFGAKDGSPYGLGLGHKLFWPVLFKRKDIGFWLIFADKFGSPTALGKYPTGATPAEQTKLLQAIGAIAQDAGIIVPEGMMIELLEAARSGSVDTYEKLARYMDEQISECVLGETMSTTAAGAGLGSNQAGVHNEVRIELAKADADLLSDTLNATLVRWIVDFNLPGAGYPTVWRLFDEGSGSDINTFTIGLQRLVNMGVQVPTRWVREQFLIPTPTADESVLEPMAIPGEGGTPPAFAEAAVLAEGSDPTPITAMTEQLAANTAAPWEAILSTVRKKVKDAQSLEALRDDLLTAFGELPIEQLTAVMETAFATADLAGRFGVEDDATGTGRK